MNEGEEKEMKDQGEKSIKPQFPLGRVGFDKVNPWPETIINLTRRGLEVPEQYEGWRDQFSQTGH